MGKNIRTQERWPVTCFNCQYPTFASVSMAKPAKLELPPEWEYRLHTEIGFLSGKPVLVPVCPTCASKSPVHVAL